MHFAIEVDTLKAFAPIDLQTAAGVVNPVPHDQPAQKIRAARREPLEEAILAVLAPAADHIQIVLLKIVDHALDVGGIVLQISVHGNDIIILCRMNARIHRGGLTEITPEFDQFERDKQTRQLDRVVLGAVIHKDDLIRQPDLLQRKLYLAVEFLYVSFFIKQRCDDRYAFHVYPLLPPMMESNVNR